jgi:hypothetical protein
MFHANLKTKLWIGSGLIAVLIVSVSGVLVFNRVHDDEITAGIKSGKYVVVTELPKGQNTVTPETNPKKDGRPNALVQPTQANDGRKVSLNEPIPIGTGVAGSPAVETTKDFVRNLEMDLLNVRGYGDLLPGAIPIREDTCLSKWAIDRVSSFSGKSAYEVQNVCGMDVVIAAGAGETGLGELIYKTTVSGAQSDVAAIILKKSTEPVVFASAQTTDKGTAVLVFTNYVATAG